MEAFTWVSFEATRQATYAGQTSSIMDISQVQSHNMRLYSIMPSTFDVLSKDLQVVSYQASGLSFGEQMYTARGSQSVIIGTYFKELLDEDPIISDS